MAKVNKVRRSRSQHHRLAPYPSPSCPTKAVKEGHPKTKGCVTSEKKDWKSAVCSVCLEFPHNAVLLLCSSYDKGCRPYMCATSRRFSNCLEQYKKAYTKVTSTEVQQLDGLIDSSPLIADAGLGNKKIEVSELLCPLCRGQVKGWTVVEPARKYLNSKKRSCMQDKCSFIGTYKQLRKHVRTKHPLAQPRAVDPVLEEKWKKLERERDRSDVISTIMSTTPGAVVLGDYVIEPRYHGVYSDFDSDSSLEDGYISLGSLDRRGQGVGLGSRSRFLINFDNGADHWVRRPPDVVRRLVAVTRTARMRGTASSRGR